MNPQDIQRYLGQPLPVCCFDSIDSTNTYAKRWAVRRGVVLADSQTQGRGRRGRSFVSPKGGLYMSLIVDYQSPFPGHLTTLAAVAALEAVREVSGHMLQIKWVNDLMFQGLKVGGILTEGVIRDDVIAKSVIGIGLNLGWEDVGVPGAGSLGERGMPYPRERLAAAIIRRILGGLPQIPQHMNRYRAHCLTLGQEVCFEYENQPMTGLAKDIDEEGALTVETEAGFLRLIAGDVSIRPVPSQVF